MFTDVKRIVLHLYNFIFSRNKDIVSCHCCSSHHWGALDTITENYISLSGKDYWHCYWNSCLCAHSLVIHQGFREDQKTLISSFQMSMKSIGNCHLLSDFLQKESISNIFTQSCIVQHRWLAELKQDFFSLKIYALNYQGWHEENSLILFCR